MPYALLRGIGPEAKRLFERVEGGEVTAQASVLVLDELAYRLLLALIKDHYPCSPLDVLRRQEASLMAEFYPMLLPRLAELASFPNLVIESLGTRVWALAQQIMLRYALKPQDALHLATMKRIGCLDLASNDSDFDRVPDIRRYCTAS